MTGYALQLRQNGANHSRARRRFHDQQLFNGFAVAQPVADRSDIVHAVYIGSELLIRPVLGDLLYAAVQIPDHAFGADDAFAVQLELHAQNAMRGGMLRTHVQDELISSKQRGLLLAVIGDRRLRHTRYWPLSMPRFSFTQAVSCWMMS